MHREAELDKEKKEDCRIREEYYNITATKLEKDLARLEKFEESRFDKLENKENITSYWRNSR